MRPADRDSGGRAGEAGRTASEWRVHTPSLLKEVLTNEGAAILRQPLNIFGHLLADVAQRASELNDPELNLLMLRLTLYDVADPEKHPHSVIDAAFASQRAALPATRSTGDQS